jgi:hypothetical protein
MCGGGCGGTHQVGGPAGRGGCQLGGGPCAPEIDPPPLVQRAAVTMAAAPHGDVDMDQISGYPSPNLYPYPHPRVGTWWWIDLGCVVLPEEAVAQVGSWRRRCRRQRRRDQPWTWAIRQNTQIGSMHCVVSCHEQLRWGHHDGGTKVRPGPAKSEPWRIHMIVAPWHPELVEYRLFVLWDVANRSHEPHS